MSLSERHDSEVSGPEFRPTLHVVPENDQITPPAVVQPETPYPLEDAPLPTASLAPLGSLALAPHDPADKEIYEKPFTLTAENFSGFYSYWYTFTTRIAFSRISPNERGLGLEEDVTQLVFEGLLNH